MVQAFASTNLNDNNHDLSEGSKQQHELVQ